MNPAKDFLLDLKDIVYYDLLRNPLPETPAIDLEQDFYYLKTRQGYLVESKKYPGLIATGDTHEELREALFDSILTYFDVPRARAKRVADQLILNLPNGDQIKPRKSFLHYLRANLARA